jgi:2-methylfumaryl-CoA hydratase
MSTKAKTKSEAVAGNFFEDFRVGQEIRHATPRTMTEADAALNVALYGSRFAINSSDEFARTLDCRGRRSTIWRCSMW